MTIVRYGQPSKLDQAERGSTCLVKNHHDEDYKLYLQVSSREEHPIWELVGLFGPSSSQEYVKTLIDIRLDKHKV